MSELSKKLHYKLDGIIDEITLYTTRDEVGLNYARLKVDGINCYAGVSEGTSDPNASRMSYKYAGETTVHKVLKIAKRTESLFMLKGYRNNESALAAPSTVMTVPIGETFYINNGNAPSISGYDFVCAVPNNILVTEDNVGDLDVKVYYIPSTVLDRQETNFAAYSTYAEGDLSMLDFMNTYSGTVFSSMFEGASITKAPKLNTSNGVNMQRMFRECIYLQSIYPLDTKGNSTFSGMFQNCSELDFTINNANIFDFTNAFSISMMFTGCTKITADKPIHLKNVPQGLNLSVLGTQHYVVDNYI